MGDRNKEIGLRIKTVRQKKRITQKQLADELNVSQTAVALWENGQRGISLELIDELAKLLRVSAGYLLFGEIDIDDKDELEHPLAGLDVPSTRSNNDKTSNIPSYEDVEQLIARNGKEYTTEQKMKLIKLLSDIE